MVTECFLGELHDKSINDLKNQITFLRDYFYYYMQITQIQQCAE